MQSHAAPIAGRQQGRLDVLEFCDAFAIIVVEQAAPLRFAGRVGAAFGELLRRQRLRSRHVLAGHDAFGAARADAVLHARHLPRVPAVEEVAEDAAVPAELAVVVG